MVDDVIAWNIFELTGSVEDYMRFKRIRDTKDDVSERMINCIMDEISSNNILISTNQDDNEWC